MSMLTKKQFRSIVAGVMFTILAASPSLARAELGVNGHEESGYCQIHNHYLAGIKIDEIFGGSPAQKVGLLPGDVIIELNGKRVSNFPDFQNITSGVNNFGGWYIRQGYPIKFGQTSGSAY